MPVMNLFPGGSTVQIPLDAPTSFSATARNAQVELTWTDPLDKYATPEGEVSETGDQLVSEWDHTVLVRKTGSQPAGPNDGTVVTSSSVRNQYQTNGYTDTGLINDTVYYYAVFAYNKDGVASEGAFVSATPQAGTPVSELAVGTLIKINLNGVPWEFLVVNQGIPSNSDLYDSSCDGTWVMLNNIYENRVWDPSDNDYQNSQVNAYLNSTFLELFSEYVQNLIKQVKIPYVMGTGYLGTVGSGPNGLSCKIFLPSAYELGWNITNTSNLLYGDGAKLDYFESGTSTSANAKRIAYLLGTAKNWYTRSPIKNSSVIVVVVYLNGRYMDIWGGQDSWGIRPMLVLPPTALVDSDNALIES